MNFRIAHCATALVLVALAACSDDPAPPSESQLRAVEDALCASFGSVGSMPLDGEIYDMSDCP